MLRDGRACNATEEIFWRGDGAHELYSAINEVKFPRDYECAS